MLLPEQKSQETINILFIASEAEPFVKVGGLGDVAGSLPLALHKLNRHIGIAKKVDIRLAIPYYEQIKKQNLRVKKVAEFDITSTEGPVAASVFSTSLFGMPVYFIDGAPISATPKVYRADFKYDADKFVFFSLACLHLPDTLGWRLDILHANDWHTALAVHALKTTRVKHSELKRTYSILTLHNLPFMGAGSEAALNKYLVQPSKFKSLPNWGRTIPLPMGLASADKIVPVSPSYAHEILSPGYGCDLQDFLETRIPHITGILNGLDTTIWNPATDEFILNKFNTRSMEKRVQNKIALQHEFGFEEDPEIPLLILISRMDRQKGVDIALDGLRLLKDYRWQAILLGTGDPHLEAACISLAEELPSKVKAAIQFDSKLSHRMYAGADILMMPSRYEPCGLAQMIAMRYGCIPVARATGGLVDSITDADTSPTGTGFLFSEPIAPAFGALLEKALAKFENKNSWKAIQKTAMRKDFSWANSAKEYYDLYISLL